MLAKERDFDLEAKAWDGNTSRVAVAEAVGPCIATHVPLTKSSRILDYGCGTGLVTLPLAHRAGKILAIDTSVGMIEQLQAKMKRSGVRNIRTFIGPLPNTCSAERNFDLIVCTQTLAHVECIEHTLRALRKYLAPQGVLAVSEMDSEAPTVGFEALTRSNLAKLVNRLGFKVCDVLDAISIRIDAEDKATTKRYYTLFATLPDRPSKASEAMAFSRASS